MPKIASVDEIRPKIGSLEETRPKMTVGKGGNVTFSGKIYNGVDLLYNKDWYYLSGLSTGNYPKIYSVKELR